MTHQARLFIAISILALSSIASAEVGESADAARKRADAAFKAGRIHEACEAYEASAKLDANIETELSLARCYEQDGKPMAAAGLYRRVAETDTNAARRQTSVAKAAKLEAKAPRLRFAINPMPRGLVITVDGVEVPAAGDVLVDQGPHEVIATAPGFAGHASAPVDRDRAIIDVIIRMEPVVDEPAPAPTPPPTPPAARTSPASPTVTAEAPVQTVSSINHRKRNGLMIGAGGVGVLAGAAVLFGVSAGKFDEEHALCPNSRCRNDADLARARSLLSDARTLRGASIGMGIGAGVLLIASGYLLLTPHKSESHVAFDIKPGSAGISYTTGF